MRLFKLFLWVSILFFLFGVLPGAHAQLSEEEREERIAASVAVLAHGNEDEQGAAIFQLVEFALPPAQGVPLFRAHLQRRTKTLAEALVIAHAVEGLAQYGTDARSALPDLIQLLDEAGTVQGEVSSGRQIWEGVTTALSRIGPNDPEVIAALKRALRRCLDNPDRLDTLMAETATALSHMGRAAHTAAPLLTMALNRSPAVATPQLAIALSHMMPEAGIAIPSLIRTLEADRAPEAVIEALGIMGPAAKSALPALHHALALPSPQTACNAFAAIAHIEGSPKLTVPASLAILRQIDQHPLSVVYAAFTTLKLQRSEAETVVPILAHIVESRNEPWLRRTAVAMLADVGPVGNREAALVLIQAAQKQDPVIALGADQAFEGFGKAAEQVAPELSALLMTDDSRLRECVLQLLYPLGRKAASAAPNLVRLLQSDVRDKRLVGNASEILRLLGRIGPEAQEAVPFLTELLLKLGNNTNGAPEYGRTELLLTVMKIGVTPDVLPAVRAMLQSAHPTQVACAAHAVALLGPQAADTIPLLLRPLRPEYKDESMTADFFYGYSFDTSARIETMRALAHLGPVAREALPLLQTYVDFPERVPDHAYRQVVLKEEARQALQAIQQTKQIP